VAGADHIITMDLHASQIQVHFLPTFYRIRIRLPDKLCPDPGTFSDPKRQCLPEVTNSV
jgi:hypothetical protein